MYDKIVDADAHVLEPMDLWEEYLEPGFRDRGIKWRTNAEGLEFWEVDGRPAVSGEVGISGSLGGVGGYPDLDGDRTKMLTPGVYTYLDGAPPGSMDPHERIQVLDDEGIDVVAELKENLTGMSETAQRKLLGANAAKIYNLPR